MQPDTWLAWWVCGAGNHPTLLRFIGVLRSEVDSHILETLGNVRIVVPQRFVDRLTEVEAPGIVVRDAAQRPANMGWKDALGRRDPQQAKAAIAGLTDYTQAMYSSNWRKA